MGYIYKTTNIVNGKIYIGKSKSLVEESQLYLGSGTLINYAIKKYGITNFTKEIVEDKIETIDKLNERETYWIITLNSTNRNVGYNVTLGGDGGDTISKNPNRKEICKNIQKSNKKTWSSLEMRKIRSESLKGNHNPFFRKKHSEETKRKISEKRKGQIVNEDVKTRISNTLKKMYDSGKLTKTVSEEQRKNHSNWMKQNQPTKQDWVREKIRNTVKGAGNPSAKHWIFENENGEKKEVTGGFENTCKDLGLSYSIMRKTLGKTRKTKFHRGWTVYERIM